MAETVAVRMLEKITTEASRIIFRNFILKIEQHIELITFLEIVTKLYYYMFFLFMIVTSVSTLGKKAEVRKTQIN